MKHDEGRMKRSLTRGGNFLHPLCMGMMLSLASFQANAETMTDNTVSLNLKNVKMVTFIQEMEQKTGLNFLYNSSLFDGTKKISVKAAVEQWQSVLDKVLKKEGLEYVLKDNYVVIRKRQAEPQATQQVQQKERTIKGKVLDEKKEPLTGVTVISKGTTQGTITDIDGLFTINVGADVKELIFSFVGMKSEVLKLEANKDEYTITMQEDVMKFKDVVVTGIFNKNKESYTGSVSVITDKDLKIAGNKNLLQSIGNIDPSFNILSNNQFGSDPNHLPEVEIRGSSSLPNLEDMQENTKTDLNTPLIIMDGFEISLQRMMDLNSNEVASITLLKDGTATAIYGSRGANGVVVITTKEPEVGRLKVSYTGSLNIETPDLSDYNLLNASDKLELERKMGYYESQNLNQELMLKNKYAQRLADINRGVDTDWLSKPLRTGVGHRHNVRLEGGDKSFRYAASLQYNNVAGVMKKSGRESVNGGINLSYKHDKLIFRNDLNIGVTKSTNSTYGSFSEYTKLNPYFQPYDDNGDLVKIFDNDVDFYGGFSKLPKNPLYNATLNMKNQSQYTSIINNFSIEWRPFEGFIARAKAGISSQDTEGDIYKPASHTDFEADQYQKDDGIFRKGRYDYSHGKSFNYDFALTLSYARTLAEKHFLYGGLNLDLTSQKSRNYNFIAEGFLEDDLDFLGSALQYQKGGKPTGSESTSRRVGLVTNLNYSYDNRYYVDFAFRTDGSSQFGKDKRFAPFYSAGLGWNIHNEKFMENVKFINRLKLRASFGQVGSQKFNAYQARAIYSYYMDDRYFQWVGAYQKALENKNLEWQKTNKWNAGVEVNMLDNRLSLTADVYLEKTSNLLSSLDLPLSNGFTSYVENVGEKENKGFEMKLNGYLIRNMEKRIIWSMTGSMVHNKDKVVKLSDALKNAYDKLLQYGGSLPNQILKEGESQNTIYVVRSLGIDPSNGRELFLKKNGEVTYNWDANDRVAVGLSEPKYRGNLSSMLRWKDFSVNVSFAYRFGGQLYNQTLIDKVENSDKRFNVDERVLQDRWQTPGQHASFKALLDDSMTQNTSRFVKDESTLTCQNIHLSYELINKPWLMKNLGVQSLTVGGDLSDLFYISTVKRERGLDYPVSRRFSLTLSLLF